MYVPPHFAETRLEVLHKLMIEYPLALVVTSTAAGLVGDHVPLVVDSGGKYGTLQGHFAQANPHQELLGQAEHLIVFQGPQAYVSPNHYPTKAEHGTVVPTWNYCVVHCWGTAEIHSDANWLREHVGKLSDTHELSHPTPWTIDEAPAQFVDTLLGHIVGFEIEITRISGKWKVSQNRSTRDRQGVIDALEMGSDQQRRIATEVRQHGPHRA